MLGAFKSKQHYGIHLIILFVLLIACKKNEVKREYPKGTNENVNTWMIDSLRRYYLWNETLPAKPNFSIAPRSFFGAVLNGADRFSYIILPGDPTSVTQNNKSLYGFDYSTLKDINTGQVIGIIKMVLSDSPASRNGLKRGDYIRFINGKQLTEENATSLQTELLSGNKVTLGLAKMSGSVFLDTRSVEVSTGVILDQREVSRIVETGGKKIGYVCFHGFNPGLAVSLKGVFANFKTQGVSELVLDLRYNSGGQVAEAAGLCAMIAPGISYSSPFIIYKGNKNGGIRNESFGAAATFDGTINFNDLLQYNLSLNRIYILGTASTASAAEVMINNLKPYLQVILIGEKTRGKDEASFTIKDMRSPKLVDWEMHPIIYKLFNAAGNGSYSMGINPDILVNEFDVLPLLSFGDAEDPLLKSAIANVTSKTKGVVSSSKNVDPIDGTNFSIVLSDTQQWVTRNSLVITHR